MVLKPSKFAGRVEDKIMSLHPAPIIPAETPIHSLLGMERKGDGQLCVNSMTESLQVANSPRAFQAMLGEQTSNTFISSEWNKSASSGLSMRIFGLSPSLEAPPELSPRVVLCPWRSSPARSLLVFPISVDLKEQGKPD